MPLSLKTLVLLVVLAGVSQVALAHHILGLPHYRYDESYPQIPCLEVVAQLGAHDAVFSQFPGRPRPGQSVRMKLYVVNRETGEPFVKPLTTDIIQERFFTEQTTIRKPFQIHVGQGPESKDYKFFHTFDEAESDSVRIALPGAEGYEVVSFPVIVGSTDSRPLLPAAVGLLGLIVLTLAVLKRRQLARSRRRALEGAV
jgi:hypothetical protein